MGWFWADTAAAPSAGTSAAKCPIDHTPKPSGCPIDHTPKPASGCPIDHTSISKSDASASQCPVDHEVLNPMNNMPHLSSEKAPGQKITLSTERTISSIPRGESEDQGLWEYPSPQQMLNAMLRKGKGDGIPEDAVESMVDVHNFLNEGAWVQILDWESEHTSETKVEPRLKKFTGRPHDLSPRAQMYMWLGKIFPETFNTVPPFDRHDWTVLRSLGREKGWKEVRYVIDYYGAPDDEDTGMPAFMLDTRPALDSFDSAFARMKRWGVPVWKRAMGDFSDRDS
ncbi:holocytochrome-c synthase [Suhomyces tanzawaensis NRRL Y-17324]|uniref:Holocytochrome c-type synthase n=1 Tax=Suhomyces tanzawaensis NRRL Y-17324 TaxID=984487 RepID=A0A1E4SQ27_9ASCO|nr:holocytochrome-c synthase [Suhomyces tanzawaensis NRRL Y-17324]ODV81606.1 holocytochrome-c synthase [Suhomyces tanzawaensis NRRL Y-17324]